jgi:hypothetical protein
MTIEEVLAREEIRDLMARYTASGDRGKVEALAACFAPDGVLEFPGASAKGPDEIVKVLRYGDRNPALQRVRHHVSNPLITLEGPEKASIRAYFLNLTNAGPDHSGVYVDRLVKLPEGWRFAHRQVRIDWQSETSLYRDFGTRR